MTTPDIPSSSLSLALSVVASLNQGIAVFGADGRVLLSNPALAALVGLQVPAHARLAEIVDPGSQLHRLVGQALAGEPVRNREIHYRRPAGKSCWLRVNTIPLKDDTGRFTGTLLMLEEISELKQAEGEIWQVEKMSALGRLAASVAHEVRNPLGAIDIQLQLLEEDLSAVAGELTERVSRRVHIARTEMRRLDGIVQNFLRFSRPPALHLQPVSPNDLLRHIFALVEPEAHEHDIDLILDLDESLPPIAVDENLLSQALLNILINAFQAVEKEPRVVLESRLDRANQQAILRIRDNGQGIPPENLEHIFEFYFTTKDEGTGLGLSIAQRIVHQHGGLLEVEGQEGSGTSVSMSLPLQNT